MCELILGFREAYNYLFEFILHRCNFARLDDDPRTFGCSFMLQVFSSYVTGSLNTVLSFEHKHEICRYIYNQQVGN